MANKGFLGGCSLQPMLQQELLTRIIQLTVPCSDDGKNFIRTDRLDLIRHALVDSQYECSADIPLAKVYSHRDFQASKPAILVSCLIDSLYTKYFATIEKEKGELHGTFDNSACNALAVEAMRDGLLPAQVLVSFTGDEENHFGGVDQTIEHLQKVDVFDNLEMVIALDLTEEYHRPCHYKVENYSVKQVKRCSLLRFGGQRDLKAFLREMIDSEVEEREMEKDESGQYHDHDLNCFSLCLPCRLLSWNMHCDEGVAISIGSLAGYMNALGELSQAINKELAYQYRTANRR